MVAIQKQKSKRNQASDAARILLKRRKARKKLIDFAGYTHSDVFGDPYQDTWFHRLIADEIDAWIASTEPYNLMIMVPPRHGKSQLVSRDTPPYIYGENPDAQIIGSSYSADLSHSMSRDSQRVMESPRYYDLFPKTKIADRNTRGGPTKRSAEEFEIVGGKGRGRYISAGVGGGITGRGANYALIDDPFKNREEAESPVMRDKAWDWYTSTLRTRLEKGGRVCLLLTRWHEDDLAGRLLKQAKTEKKADKWKIISLPALFDKGEYNHPLDKRKIGEALWPDKYSRPDLLRIKATIGSYDWQALFQQKPTPPGGAIIQRHWLTNIIEPDKVPTKIKWVRFWDLAVSEKKSADRTASVQLGVDRYEDIYLRAMIAGKWSWPKVKRILIATAQYELVPVGIEEVGTQKGFVQDLQEDKGLRGIAVKGCGVDRDKLSRALPWVAKAEAGKLFLVNGGWIMDFIDEAVRWRGKDGDEDDRIDAISGAYQMQSGFGTIAPLGDLYPSK